MIKLGIIGGAAAAAGELLRILVNHPDVDLRFIYAPSLAGHPVTDIHHGLMGECDMAFTENPSFDRLDVVMLCEPSPLAQRITLNPDELPELRVIDLTGVYARQPEAEMIFGLSEVNRKPLVRGATRAYVGSAAMTAAAIALYPFASSLLLNSDIKIALSGRYTTAWDGDAEALAEYLRGVQNSFCSKVLYSPSDRVEEGSGRGMRLEIDFPCSLSVEEAIKLYDPIYDDHNFTFIAPRPVSVREVEGTQKCLLHISKPDPASIHIEAVVDATMRGGAGDATHLLNLLFGLHERTGLALKASNF